MDAELIQAWAAILGALAWLVVILLLALFLRELFLPAGKSRSDPITAIFHAVGIRSARGVGWNEVGCM
jgi:hypothetical protein